jgi:lipopolysaccharide/colanic/teichoic acid biosynthesis glycosyltransferase
MKRHDSYLAHAGGYQRRNPVVTEIFNVSVAIVLFILSLPVFITMTLVIWLREGRPIFYKGRRLGRGKKIFYMFKFRTLVKDAEDRIQGDLLGKRTDLITPTGKFMRDTRLDELPQLWNVIRRDMDLVGPRPVRPLVYDKMCTRIPGYDKRFKVRPGLIGFSQIFTPHSAPKKIRSIIDNKLLHKLENPAWNLRALMLTSCFMMRTIFHCAWRVFRGMFQQKMLHKYREKRRYERIMSREVSVFLREPGKPWNSKYLGKLLDINPEAFRMVGSAEALDLLPATVSLHIKTKKIGCRNGKNKLATCEGVLYRHFQRDDGKFEYVIMYTTTSPLNEYLIHQYFLKESVG